MFGSAQQQALLSKSTFLKRTSRKSTYQVQSSSSVSKLYWSFESSFCEEKKCNAHTPRFTSNLYRSKLWLTKFSSSSIIGHMKKVNIVNSWNLNWRLETHKKSSKWAFLWLHFKQIFSFKNDTPSCHFIIRMPNKNLYIIHALNSAFFFATVLLC